LTAAELSDHCDKFKQEHGLMVLFEVLEHITECHAQAAGVAILEDEDLDEMECRYFTVQ
jgi:hypothetical protein